MYICLCHSDINSVVVLWFLHFSFLSESMFEFSPPFPLESLTILELKANPSNKIVLVSVCLELESNILSSDNKNTWSFGILALKVWVRDAQLKDSAQENNWLLLWILIHFYCLKYSGIHVLLQFFFGYTALIPCFNNVLLHCMERAKGQLVDGQRACSAMVVGCTNTHWMVWVQLKPADI